MEALSRAGDLASAQSTLLASQRFNLYPYQTSVGVTVTTSAHCESRPMAASRRTCAQPTLDNRDESGCSVVNAKVNIQNTRKIFRIRMSTITLRINKVRRLLRY